MLFPTVLVDNAFTPMATLFVLALLAPIPTVMPLTFMSALNTLDPPIVWLVAFNIPPLVPFAAARYNVPFEILPPLLFAVLSIVPTVVAAPRFTHAGDPLTKERYFPSAPAGNLVPVPKFPPMIRSPVLDIGDNASNAALFVVAPVPPFAIATAVPLQTPLVIVPTLVKLELLILLFKVVPVKLPALILVMEEIAIVDAAVSLPFASTLNVGIVVADP